MDGKNSTERTSLIVVWETCMLLQQENYCEYFDIKKKQKKNVSTSLLGCLPDTWMISHRQYEGPIFKQADIHLTECFPLNGYFTFTVCAVRKYFKAMRHTAMTGIVSSQSPLSQNKTIAYVWREGFVIRAPLFRTEWLVYRHLTCQWEKRRWDSWHHWICRCRRGRSGRSCDSWFCCRSPRGSLRRKVCPLEHNAKTMSNDSTVHKEVQAARKIQVKVNILFCRPVSRGGRRSHLYLPTSIS